MSQKNTYKDYQKIYIITMEYHRISKNKPQIYSIANILQYIILIIILILCYVKIPIFMTLHYKYIIIFSIIIYIIIRYKYIILPLTNKLINDVIYPICKLSKYYIILLCIIIYFIYKYCLPYIGVSIVLYFILKYHKFIFNYINFYNVLY